MYYKVFLGSRRYTTESTDIVCADSAEEACSRAIALNSGMRFAIARKAEITKEIVEKILSIDGYVYIGGNKISFYGHDGFVVDLANGCSLFNKDKASAIYSFIRGVNSFAR